MTGRYEQMRIQVPIAKDTPIERIYEGAGYIHRLRYPQGCVEKKEAGDEWPAHTKKISSGAYRAAVNAFDEKHILPALHAKRSVLLNAGTTMDVPTTAAGLAKIESDLRHVYLWDGQGWLDIVSIQSRMDNTHPGQERGQEKEAPMKTYYRTTEEYTQRLTYQIESDFGSDGEFVYQHTDRQILSGTPILASDEDISIYDLRYPEGAIHDGVDDTWRAHAEEIDEAAYEEAKLTYDQEHILPRLYRSKQQLQHAREYEHAMDRAEDIFFNDPEMVKEYWDDDAPPMRRDIPDILYKAVQGSSEPSLDKDEIQMLYEVIDRTEQDAYETSVRYEGYVKEALEDVDGAITDIEQRLAAAGRVSPDTFRTAHILDQVDMLARENLADPGNLRKGLDELLSDDIAHKHERHTNQAYYKYDTETYYLKNSNGVYVRLWRGGEIDGETLTDRDIVLSINHPTLDYDTGVRYDMHEMPEHTDWMGFAGVMEGKDLQYQLTQDPFLYTTLNEELQKDSRTIQNTLSGLEEVAHELYKEEMEYADISPNGGADVVPSTPAEHFLEDMKELSGYPALVEAGEQRLAESRMGREFLDTRIEEDKMKLYYIDNAELYDELHELELENIYTDGGLLHTRETLDTVKQDIRKKQENVKELQKLKDQLMKKRYRFWQFRQHRENLKKLESIDKEIKHMDEEIYEDTGLEQILEDKLPTLERYEGLQAQLKAPYQDHILKEAYDPVHGYRTSMDALCDHRTDIEQELQKLEDVKSLQPFTKRLDIEIDIRQSDIANAKLQLLGLKETFGRVLEKPGVYDTRLTLTCNGRGYLKDRVLEDGEIEKLQELMTSGHASPIIKQAQAILREDHHIDNARELSSFARQIDRETIIEESFSAEIQTTLATAF